MLTSNLLATRKYKNTVKPQFREKNGENLELAESLINLFSSNMGSKFEDVEELYRQFEEGYGGDFRFPRGLFALLERRATFEPRKSKVSPYLIRQVVFEYANTLYGGSPTTPEKKEKVLKAAGEKLQLTVEEVTQGLWADEMIIVNEFQSISADELLSQYNLSLIQTLLFNATALEVWVDPDSQNLKEALRWINYYGLMYEVHKTPSGFHLVLDGPVSTLKFTSRYGTSLAKFLPHLLEGQWRLKATIKEKKIYDFTLEKKDFTPYYDMMEEGEGEPVFDSKVEENFYRQFKAANTGWTIRREPEPLINEYVMFPDFTLEGFGQTVYLEVMGFWTPEYLQKKLKKIGALKGVEFIVCVNTLLECSPKKPKGVEVIYYRKTIPLKQVLDLLKKHEKKHMEKDSQSLDKAFDEDKLTGEVVEVEKLAKEYKVSIESLKKRLTQLDLKGYEYTGNLLVSGETVKNLKKQVNRLYQREANYGEVQTILTQTVPEDYVAEVFNRLGYEIEWKSLNPDDSKIRKK